MAQAILAQAILAQAVGSSCRDSICWSLKYPPVRCSGLRYRHSDSTMAVGSSIAGVPPLGGAVARLKRSFSVKDSKDTKDQAQDQAVVDSSDSRDGPSASTKSGNTLQVTFPT